MDVHRRCGRVVELLVEVNAARRRCGAPSYTGESRAFHAKTIEVETGLTLNGSALASLFDSNLRLDFSSVTTRNIYDRCFAYLLVAK